MKSKLQKRLGPGGRKLVQVTTQEKETLETARRRIRDLLRQHGLGVLLATKPNDSDPCEAAFLLEEIATMISQVLTRNPKYGQFVWKLSGAKTLSHLIRECGAGNSSATEMLADIAYRSTEAIQNSKNYKAIRTVAENFPSFPVMMSLNPRLRTDYLTFLMQVDSGGKCLWKVDEDTRWSLEGEEGQKTHLVQELITWAARKMREGNRFVPFEKKNTGKYIAEIRALTASVIEEGVFDILAPAESKKGNRGRRRARIREVIGNRVEALAKH